MGNRKSSLPLPNEKQYGKSEPCTPLRCVLAHWSTLKPLVAVKITFKREKLRVLCATIWPTYFLGDQQLPWPPEGTVNPEIIQNLSKFLAKGGKMEEELYSAFFFNLAAWTDIQKLCGLITPSQRVCPLIKSQKVKLAPVPDAPPLVPDEPLSVPDLGRLGPNLKLLSPSHTRTGQAYSQEAHLGPSVLAPLRQVPMGNRLAYIHTPFTTGDLFNWKESLPPYREAPQQYVDLVQQVISTHRPTVPDLFTLVSAFLGAEDWQQVLKAAIVHYTTAQTQGLQDGGHDAAWPDPNVVLVPTFEADPNTDHDLTALRHSQEAILHGLCTGVPKIVSFHRVHQILQEPKESPTDFLNRLKDGFRRFTDLDPDLPANETLLKMTFVGQSAPDIQCKLQKLEAPATQNFETLIQTAFIVFAQRDEEEEKKEDRKMRKQAALLAIALQPKPKGRGLPKHPEKPRPNPLRRDQCTRCKRTGHWKNECPLGACRGRNSGRNFGGRPPHDFGMGEAPWPGPRPEPQPLMSALMLEFYPSAY
ncbi:uncharacterized protein LOC112541634 [Python bivittatus]|uniref:Uncharacterized protein LOC112541634 n=1 Tax=Python bivittatus TaxID=176946 RepID=A0A9F5IXG7_PYTBI|nr:uncharacterized protein LOC112541634 [Python bivittatus]